MRTIPPHAVDRPALRVRLDAGLKAPLTLVVAPAGSGKTVLLAQWATSRPDLSVAWVDVTRSDDDVLRFARRLLSAIAEVEPRMRQGELLVGTPDGGLGEPFIELFAEEIAELGEIVVIFDDLHLLTKSEIVADLWRLADRLPPNAHFIFSSRTDLRLGWSRHRLEHGLVELRQANLAFDDEMTGRVLERITGMSVSAGTAASVTRHTEGWAAGVQLSALSLRFQDDPDSFVDHMDETDRLIIDYLSEEVFDAQTAERRDALLRLSTLDELCASLVESVAGITDGDGFLRALEQESMFLMAVPARIGWYRFHHLFRDLLRYRLRATDADLEPRLLVAAAEWHLERAELEPAVEYLIHAHAWQAIFDVVLSSGREVYERVRTTSLARWLSLVPESVRIAEPNVELLYGIVVGMSGRGALSGDVLRGALERGTLDVGGQQIALTYLGLLVQFQPNPQRFLDTARKSLALLAQHPDVVPPNLLELTSRPILQVASELAAARSYFLLGDLGQARERAVTALAMPGGEYGPYRVHVLGTLALIEAWNGQLTRASELADEALDIARQLSLLAHPAPADAYLARAIAAIQRGEPEAGGLALYEGNARASANQRNQLLWVAHVASALIDPLGTDAAAVEPPGPPPPLAAKTLSALESRRARLGGMPRAASRRPEQEWSTLAFEQIASAIERGAIADAHAQFARARRPPRDFEPIVAIEQGLIAGWLAAVEGHTAESREHVIAALEVAESEWLVYPITRSGPAIAALIANLPGRPSRFREVVLARAGSTPREGSELLEPLTSRELELLAYLPSRLTNIELAARCYVSVNTIKTHMAHIYRKLDATGRDAAIARARELGMLPESESLAVGDAHRHAPIGT